MSLLLDNTSLVTGICIIIPPENSLLVACRVVRHDKQILISLSVDIANSGICFNLLLPGVPLVTMVRFRLCMCMCVFFFLFNLARDCHSQNCLQRRLPTSPALVPSRSPLSVLLHSQFTVLILMLWLRRDSWRRTLHSGE